MPSEEGHPAYALYTRSRGKQTSLNVPDELVEKVEEAVQNGNKVRELLVEAGRRYVNALRALSGRGDERRAARGPFSVDRDPFFGVDETDP